MLVFLVLDDNCQLNFVDYYRFIPWGKCSLNLTINDYDGIVGSNAMFCRKVVDEELAKKIFERFGPKE